MKKQPQKPNSTTHESQKVNDARSTRVSKTASTLSDFKLLRALGDAAKRGSPITAYLPDLHGDGIKAALLEAARRKTVQHLVVVNTFSGDDSVDAEPDQDGDLICMGVEPTLQNGEYPVRLLIHPNTDAATLKRLLGKILKEEWLRMLEVSSAEAAVKSAVMMPVCPNPCLDRHESR